MSAGAAKISRTTTTPIEDVPQPVRPRLRQAHTMGENFSSDGTSPPHMTLYAASKLVSRARRMESGASRRPERQASSGALGSKGSPPPGGYGSVQGVDEGGEDGQPMTPMLGNGGKLEKESQCSLIWHMLTGKKLNIMFVFVPLAVASGVLGWNPTTVFLLNFFAMIPLASLLGDFTEEMAAHTNQTIGGLINATFGNAVEVVVALQAMRANQIRVVQASLLGSVFSNMLLVLGCCFFFGGLKHKEQKYNSTSAVANMGLLMLSSLALVVPTPMAESKDIEHVLTVSRMTGVALLSMYIQLLIFQLKTHQYLFEEGEEEEDEPELAMPTCIVGLAGCTLSVAYLSDFLVDSIDGFTEEANLSKTFVGIILLPIIGNAVEHITAVSVAMKDKMELAMGVAVGSATQVSMFVIPFVVLSGWVMDRDMTLAFPPEEVMLYILSIVIVSTCCATGRSNWLLGSLLITTYVLLAFAFWYEKAEGAEGDGGKGEL